MINKIADYFIWLCQQTGDLMTNLRLQKLVYYAQAWHLALKNDPLFEEDFQAWIHGPVEPTLYARFAENKWKPIVDEIKKPELSKGVETHLNEIMDAFGKYTAYDLERMTHNEDPWILARKGLAPDEPSTEIIPKDIMKDYYKSLQ